jgi:hypothetical protein
MLRIRVPASVIEVAIGVLIAITAAIPAVCAQGQLQSVTSPAPQVVELELSGTAELSAYTLLMPHRFVLDLRGVATREEGSVTVTGRGNNGSIESVRWGQYMAEPTPVARVVLDLDSAIPVQAQETFLASGARLLRLTSSGAQATSDSGLDWRALDLPVGTAPPEARDPAAPTASGNPDQTTSAPRRPLVVPTEPLGWDASIDSGVLAPESSAVAATAPRRPIVQASGATTPESSGQTSFEEVPLETKLAVPTSISADGQPGDEPAIPSSTTENVASPTVETSELSPTAGATSTTRMESSRATTESDGRDKAMADEAEEGFWLTRIDGVRIELSEPWKIDGRRVIYTSSRGVLASMRLEDVDLEASSKSRE